MRPPEWAELEKVRREKEIASLNGVTIRRRPPTGPAQHAVGPFEFRIENEDNIPRNILEEIVWYKDVEVSEMKEKMPLSTLVKVLQGVAPARDFVGALKERLKETEVPALIAEVKKASPSKGVIQPDFDPVRDISRRKYLLMLFIRPFFGQRMFYAVLFVLSLSSFVSVLLIFLSINDFILFLSFFQVRIAKAYEKGGAACLSVLTDSKFFQVQIITSKYRIYVLLLHTISISSLFRTFREALRT